MPSSSPCPALLMPQVLLEATLQRGADAEPLQRQLHRRLQEAILAGRLAPGSRLPGSRALAEGLGVSRNTIIAAYEQLSAEGYLRPDRQGTRVATLARPGSTRSRQPATLPNLPDVPERRDASPALTPHPNQHLAQRLTQILPTGAGTQFGLQLRHGVPPLAHFPLAAWRRALDRAITQAGPGALAYGEPLGEPALRAAVARHLSVARGVRCSPDQVVITEGAQEALSLCARLLSNPGDRAWVENPGYRGAKAALRAADLTLHPLPVDREGLCATAQDWALHPPRLIYVTPSHQYPTGAVLSASRRLQLMEDARRHGCWLIEDDYDSEFRHAGESIGAMQGLVPQAPVLYVGTFSKTLFPSLRLGFLVLPEVLLPSLQGPLGELLRGGQRHSQLALAQFMESGEFARHLGRMRRLYRSRQSALRQALQQHLAVPHQIEGGQCGLHLCVRFGSAWPDQGVAEQARQHGMAPSALSGFALPPGPSDNGLVLGYGNTSSELFAPLIQRLSGLMRAL